jgi:prephenate dehydrogenase
VGANLVLTISPNTPQSGIDEAKEYARAMKFGRIAECSAEEHDRKIAVTSQLAHIVSNAYVKSPQTSGCDGFTGGSFQDMTRIAGVDEKMWTQLYMFNRENILTELTGLIERLQTYQTALAEQDEQTLTSLLKEGREKRESIKTNTRKYSRTKKNK